MPKYSGTAVQILWYYAGGTHDLTGNYTTVSMEETAETIDVSSGTAVYNEYLPGQGDVTYSVEGFWGGASGAFGSAQLAALRPRNQGTIAIGPMGTAAGSPKLGGVAIVTSASLEAPFAASDAITYTVELQGTGGPVWTAGSVW
jgi:predicted secreted protein